MAGDLSQKASLALSRSHSLRRLSVLLWVASQHSKIISSSLKTFATPSCDDRIHIVGSKDFGPMTLLSALHFDTSKTNKLFYHCTTASAPVLKPLGCLEARQTLASAHRSIAGRDGCLLLENTTQIKNSLLQGHLERLCFNDLLQLFVEVMLNPGPLQTEPTKDAREGF